MTRQEEKMLLGVAGEFLVAGKLALLDFLPFLTYKNHRDVDIFAIQDGKTVQIQVKAKQEGKGEIILSEKTSRLPGFFVIVEVSKEKQVRFYITSAKELGSMAERNRAAYLEKHPATKKALYTVNTSQLGAYEDQWDVLKA
jgi:hypothetical protein